MDYIISIISIVIVFGILIWNAITDKHDGDRKEL